MYASTKVDTIAFIIEPSGCYLHVQRLNVFNLAIPTDAEFLLVICVCLPINSKV